MLKYFAWLSWAIGVIAIWKAVDRAKKEDDEAQKDREKAQKRHEELIQAVKDIKK